jgi:hypothetical protein
MKRRQTSGSWAGLRLCMVLRVGSTGGSRAWQACWATGQTGDRPPRSTGVGNGSRYEHLAVGAVLCDDRAKCGIDRAGPVARQLCQVVESGGGAEEQRYAASRVRCPVLVAPVTS